jgi:hypothetical protein
LEFYEDDGGNEPVLEWLRRLSPRKRRAIGVAMFEILQHEGPNVVETRYGRQIGPGIFEFRHDQDAAQILVRTWPPATTESERPERILLRVFCHAYGDRIVLLLAGCDKGKRPSGRYQQDQIELAKARLRSWMRRQRQRLAD